MPSRANLNVMARNVGIDPSTYPNDSKLEQRVLYELKNSATAAGTLATQTVTSSGVNVTTADTITIGGRTYTFKTALTEVAATQVLTSTGTTPTDGDQVSVGSQTYTFKTALSTNPTIPNQVLIGGSAAVALDNLKLAINGGSTNYPTAADASGIGTTWSTGTVRHPDVNATTNTNTQQTVAANVVGTAANAMGVGTNNTGPTLSWAAPNLAGGVNPIADEIKIQVDAATTLDVLKDAINATAVTAGAGNGYSTGTKAHQDVTATTNTNTTQVVQAISYDGGNLIPTTKSAVTLTWGAATLAGGVPKVVAQAVADNQQIAGDARV